MSSMLWMRLPPVEYTRRTAPNVGLKRAVICEGEGAGAGR